MDLQRLVNILVPVTLIEMMIAIGLLASYVPAVKASSVDPTRRTAVEDTDGTIAR